jgi:hypothetical protein
MWATESTHKLFDSQKLSILFHSHAMSKTVRPKPPQKAAETALVSQALVVGKTGTHLRNLDAFTNDEYKSNSYIVGVTALVS